MIELTNAMEKKLKHLTIVSMAIRNKCLAYSDLQNELHIRNVRELEDLIIESIYSGAYPSGFSTKILEKNITATFLVRLKISFMGNWIRKTSNWR